ncbi:MAG: RNA polymerase subunit sigma-24 [Armatimonadota bacterium]|nr:MAG: RNA polymerase subunit sigma-24 [Armatimonadota bacterium]
MESGRESEDARLIARFRAGDMQAVETLFWRYADAVLAYATRLLGNRTDAEEVLSEVFLRAFEGCMGYRAEGTFQAWLFRIARNCCIDRLRQPRLLRLEDSGEPVQGDDTAEIELRVAVQRALQRLPEEYRTVLLLCDVEEFTAKEVAEILGRSVPSVKGMLYRARAALRDALSEEWGEEA